MRFKKMYLKALVTVEGIITAGKFYRLIGTTENYYVIKNDINKHECIRKHFFIKE
jgi:hypothetical protein